ncbi:MAG: HD-GYP domain-containing protein [Betaproteobacteria bacterium]|nr:HD-GYP domain-containing protein [Betaproteobacteria bacterium]
MANKLIKIKDLVPGMYVDEINCSLKERERIGETRNFLVISKNEIDRLAALGIQELYINPAKGLDHFDEDDERRKTNQAIAELARLKNIQNAQKPKVLADELYDARMLQEKVCAELESAIGRLRAGKKIDIEPVWPLLEEIYKSVSGNKDAIVTVCRKKKKGGYALEHSVSHCALMMAFGQTLGMDKDAVLELGLGGLFHDIGNIRVPAAIMNKPGKLTAEELAVIRKHPSWGGEFVQGTEGFPEKALAVVMEHHERLDGTGYPNQLKDHEISLFGQMASIVDVYDARISIRAYGSAADPCLVIRQLFEGAGKQFHKELVQQFIKTIGIYPVGTLARLESNKLGIVIRQTKSLTQPVVRIVFDLKQNCFMPPEDVDLSRPRAKMDKVIGHEAAEKWKIDPFRFISPELARL